MTGATGDVDVLIEHAVSAQGWSVVPQILYRGGDNALLRVSGPHTDLVTIPMDGWSTVIRLRGGPVRGGRRHTGTEVWRHVVPLHLAMLWVNSDPSDDADLARWDSSQWFTAGPNGQERS